MWREIPVLRGGGFELLSSSRGGCRTGRCSWSCIGCSLFHCYLWVQGLVVEVCPVLFRTFSEPLHLQGASSNFLVLRIKAHKTSQSCFRGPGCSGKEGLKRGFCPISLFFDFVSWADLALSAVIIPEPPEK